MATTKTRSQFVVQEYPYWRKFLCTDFSNLDVASTSRIEAGAFLVRGLLEMKVARGQRSKLACSPSSDVSKYARDAYFHLQLSGECRARFEGTAIGLMPGDFYPVDSIRLTGSDPRPVEVLAVRLPRCALASSGFDLHQASCLLRGPRGLGAVSAGFVRALLNNPDGHSPDSLQSLTSSLANLMAVTFGAPFQSLEWSRYGLRREMRQLVARFIGDQAGDPHLTPDAVSELFRISPRLLNALLEEHGVTFGRLVLEGRLDGCAKDLACTVGTLRPIADIALRWGFSNTAYFCRVFRERFGRPASEYRSMPSTLRLEVSRTPATGGGRLSSPP